MRPSRVSFEPSRLDSTDERESALLAGWTVRSAARESGRTTFAARGSTARRSVEGRRCPADEQSQCRIVRAFLLTLAQRLRVDRVEHRTADRIDHRNHDLQATRRVEHDPIEVGTTTGHGDEVTYLSGVHNSGSLPVTR
jgi:hypothetical protein